MTGGKRGPVQESRRGSRVVRYPHYRRVPLQRGVVARYVGIGDDDVVVGLPADAHLADWEGEGM